VEAFGFTTNLDNIQFFRIKLEPFSLDNLGQASKTGILTPRLLVGNQIPDNALITAEVLRDRDPLATAAGTAVNKVVRTFVKQFHTSDGRVFTRSEEPEFVQGESLVFSELRQSEIVAIDVAIPNGWCQLDTKGMVLPECKDLKVNIWPHGEGSTVSTSKPHFINRQINFDETRRNARNTKFERYYLCNEFKRQAFLSFTDMPYSGEHLIQVQEDERLGLPDIFLPPG